MTEEEFKSGVSADGEPLMQPPSDYIADASRTLSPAWHGDKVALAQLKGRINGAIDALNKLDQLKKTLFYGRDNNLIADGQNSAEGLPDVMFMPVGADATNVFHAVIGKATEAGELLEALRDCYNGKVFDRVNAIEEIGDGFWYDAILLNEMRSEFGDAQRINIDKLKARFPDKFEAISANERDLSNERRILEQRNGSLGDEITMHDALVDALPPALPIPLEPSAPVGGKENVEAVEARADTAFKSVQAVTDAGEQFKTNDDLSVGIGERLQDMPAEKLARQPVRKSDLENK